MTRAGAKLDTEVNIKILRQSEIHPKTFERSRKL